MLDYIGLFETKSKNRKKTFAHSAKLGLSVYHQLPSFWLRLAAL
jgi:hypothetical protein